MVRKIYTRQINNHDVFQHRISTYISRRVHGAHAKTEFVKQIIKVAEVATTKNVLKTEDEEYALSPKRPIPSVVLRKDIMAKQRTRVSL